MVSLLSLSAVHSPARFITPFLSWHSEEGFSSLGQSVIVARNFTPASVLPEGLAIDTTYQNPKILENHLKDTDPGEVLVRCTTQGSQDIRPTETESVGSSKDAHGHRSVAAMHPPLAGPEVAVKKSGLRPL